jgi:hypothetical protein
MTMRGEGPVIRSAPVRRGSPATKNWKGECAWAAANGYGAGVEPEKVENVRNSGIVWVVVSWLNQDGRKHP